jgi:hypothetical protein
MKLRTLLAGCLTLLALHTTAQAAPLGADDCALPAGIRADLLDAWAIARPHLARELEQELERGNPYVLYDVAQYTHPLIGAARDCGLHPTLDELCLLYEGAFVRLETIRRGGERFDGWACSGPACPSWPKGGAVAPFEVILYSAQFLYAASALINAVSLVPEGERTAAMRSLLGRAPYIADTYARWLTSTGEPLYPRGVSAAVSALLGNRFRNDDKQLQLAGGCVELLCAAEREPGALGIAAERRAQLREFTQLYWRLMQSRTAYDSGGHATYDEAWGTIARSKCSSHTGSTPPTAAQCTGSARLSLDLGHFARVPQVAASYQRCGAADAQPLLAGLAAQFADRVWNGDIENPRFFSYFSGAGMYGWYNRTFDARGKVTSKGWAPLSLSNKAPQYFHLGRYSPRVRRIAAAYYAANRAKLRAGDPADMDRVLYVLAALPGFVE